MADLIPMLAAAAGAAAGGGEVDPNFNQTVLLLHGDGTNGAQNNTFLDSSSNNFTITRAGNTTQGTFSPFSAPDGRWSNYFDGVDDHFTVGTNTDWTFLHNGSSWTIEFDIYHSSTSLIVLLSTASASTERGFSLQLNSVATNDVTVAFFKGTTGYTFFSSSGNLVINQWNHVGVTFDTSTKTCTFYINGVQRGSSSDAGFAYSSSSPANTLVVGVEEGSSLYDYTGYLSNLRISNVVRTGMTSVPTAPYTSDADTKLLTCQSNRFVDNSANGFAITAYNNVKVTPFSPFAPTAAYSASVNGGSGYFDGTGDYLQSSITALSGQFTIEFWLYRPAAGNTFIFNIGDSFTSSGAEIYIGSSGTQLNYYNNNNTQINGGVPPAAGQWSYIAATRDASNDVRMYVNGVQVGSSYNQSGTLSTDLRLGVEYYNSAITGYLNGYMGAFRISDTVRTVTSVPTAPFASDGNTVFLANFTNAGIFDNTGKNNLETVGNAQIDTTTKQFGTGSMEFPGTNDYLAVAGTTSDYKWLHDKTTDYTIQFWMYPNSVTGRRAILETGAASASSGVLLETNGTRLEYTVYRGVSGSVTNADAGASAVATGQWYFVSIVVTTTEIKIYIDGVLKVTTSWSLAGSTAAQQRTLLIAGDTLDGTIDGFVGFIDDMRITRGVARDGTVVPTKAFPDL